ncbi:WhiB family transcriptional regulator [Streptomyces sp. NPDC059629]|uniref:WhiB family transcriptional regulator n=1 Tax=Streptomyces sp. NPDC059629 TaxID=3346889 RepID=UPI0036A6BA8B
MHQSVSRWRQRAACLGTDPELFFPPSEPGPAQAQIEEAKKICHACPTQWTCLGWALSQGVTDGIWGGSTERERRVMVAELRTPIRPSLSWEYRHLLAAHGTQDPA